MANITDLKGTTWYVPSGWSAEVAYGAFNLEGTSSFDKMTQSSFYTFNIGYGFTFEMSEKLNTITFGADPDNTLGSAVASSSGFDLTITGGTDATNTSLIEWLETYGELQGGEETPTKKFTRLYIGDTVVSSGGRAFKRLSSMPKLSAPTLSLDGDTLTITDESKLATSFDILADGEVKVEMPAKFSAAEVASGTALTATINCCVGETIVAAIATRDTLTVNSGWTLISTSGINSVDTTNGQRLSWAYKVAESTSESITVTQASAQRLYINMIALSKGASLVDNGYTYKNNTAGGTITVSKPSGLVLWGMTSSLWVAGNLWSASNGIYIVQLGADTASRLGIGFDSTDTATVTFDAAADIHIVVGCLSVIGG